MFVSRVSACTFKVLQFLSPDHFAFRQGLHLNLQWIILNREFLSL